jgi:hypothetical protein
MRRAAAGRYSESMKLLWLLLLLPALGAAQSVHWGFLGGTVMQSPYIPQISEGTSFTPGGLLELRFPGRFAIEANALYRRQGYTGPFQVDEQESDLIGALTSRSNVLDVPLLLKYRHPVQDFINAFVTSGYVRRWRSESFRVSGTRETVGPVPQFPGIRTTQGGFAIGGGVELDGGTLRMSIGYRYSRLGEFRSDKSHDLLVSFIF